MRLLMVLFILLTACGTKGEAGDDGVNGAPGVAGPQGRPGPAGPAGRPGDVNPSPVPGDFVKDSYSCAGRYDYKDTYWYDLRLWVYDLSNDSRYLFGRSDRVLSDDRRVDSGSFFGDELFTSEFRYWKTKSGWSWEYKNGDKGRFDCE